MAHIISKLAINLLLLISVPAFAGVGSISEFKGGGSVKRGAKATPAAKGSNIEKNDTVSTNSQGRFKITFVDATTVNITQNSRLVIDDFVYDGNNKSKGKLGLKLALGTARYTSGGIAHGNARGVGIRTPTATIAVRGTDFVMSVDEAGRSTIVLVPECYNDTDITKINFDCPAGAIDVITAAGIVTLDKPFQATVVENAYAPPAPPVMINPSLKGMDNNIQIAPLETDGGQSLIGVARDSLKKFVNPSKASSDDNKNPSTNSSSAKEPSDDKSTTSADISDTVDVVTQVSLPQITPTVNNQENSNSPNNDNIEEIASVIVNVPVPKPIEETSSIEPNENKTTIYTNVSLTFKKMIQEGWAYSRISRDRNQAVVVWLPKDTEAQVVSSQNGIIDVYNFANHTWPTSGTGMSQGNITVIQKSGVK
jgi:hypothetical protein